MSRSRGSLGSGELEILLDKKKPNLKLGFFYSALVSSHFALYS
jgi:hypothetical protein